MMTYSSSRNQQFRLATKKSETLVLKSARKALCVFIDDVVSYLDVLARASAFTVSKVFARDANSIKT